MSQAGKVMNVGRRQRKTNRSVTRANAPKEYTRDTYPAIFSDTDQDSILDVDDPHPFTPGDTESIEEVQLSDEIGELIDVRGTYVPATQDVMQRLEEIGIGGSYVQGRVKSPYSLVNKLRRKKLGELTDIAGTRIIVPDQPSVELAKAAIESEFEILEKEDFYKEPLAGYRAIHYIVRRNGLPVEVQVKTRRMGTISDASHTPYKTGRLDPAAMDRLTSLAAAADAGDRKAAQEIDPLLRDKNRLTRMLSREQNPRLQQLARRLARGE